MKKRDPVWVTDAYRKLRDAEEARYRWLVETSQWRVNGDPHHSDGSLSRTAKVVIAVAVLLFMQLMWQRATVDSPVTDELIGMESQAQRH